MNTFQKKNVLGHDIIFDVTNYVMIFFSFFQMEIGFKLNKKCFFPD